MKPRLWYLLPLAFCTAAPVLAQRSVEQSAYPTKPVRMVIAFAPGGGTDIIGRIVAQKLSEAWALTVVADNRPGAGSTLGTEIVAKAAPDGYTLQTVSMSHALNVSLYRKLPYDPVNDFMPVSQIATAPNVLVVHPSVPAQSVKELIALARAQPGRLNFSSSGNGGVSHLSAELFRSVAGIDIVHGRGSRHDRAFERRSADHDGDHAGCVSADEGEPRARARDFKREALTACTESADDSRGGFPGLRN
jgi:tripartite-type tricarboxylate transporter receptor subunit TctC